VWPWLIGPFIEAWVNVQANEHVARATARDRFLTPLFAHMDAAAIGHVSEISDAESPFTPRGCPWQAWSLSEVLRVVSSVLTPRPPTVVERAKPKVSRKFRRTLVTA
jgi:glycogen debranching enzyme